jgi:ribose-phosphate pyrophosphokinase
MANQEQQYNSIPVGPLGIIALESCKKLGKRVDDYIVNWRSDNDVNKISAAENVDYQKDSYLIETQCPRFGTGEAKGVIKQSVRGKDLYLLVDVCNYNIKYTVCGHANHMSPDDHYQDLKRIIAAIGGKARKITVIMPFLYESRQHRRTSRESLDCALALQELTHMGVENIITFDAHDPRVQNAIPLKSLETVQPTYQFIKALVNNTPDLTLDSDHIMVISPDEGAMSRAVYFANVLGVDMGMFYKRRDYTTITNGSNPIVAHEFLGADVEGKDVIVLDDMISSGDSIIDTAKELKKRKAKRIFVCSTFGLFTNGLDKFDKAYEDGLIYRIITTNLIYQPEELLSKPYYITADMCKYIALLIDTLNHDGSISELLSPTKRIQKFLNK